MMLKMMMIVDHLQVSMTARKQKTNFHHRMLYLKKTSFQITSLFLKQTQDQVQMQRHKLLVFFRKNHNRFLQNLRRISLWN